jgi:hypothetical protein
LRASEEEEEGEEEGGEGGERRIKGNQTSHKMIQTDERRAKPMMLMLDKGPGKTVERTWKPKVVLR